MVNFLQNEPDLYARVVKTGAFELIKECINVTKEAKPFVNIDAMLCLANMMNVKELALDPAIMQAQHDTMLNHFCVMYFAYS